MKMPRKEKRKIKINTTALPDIIFMLLFFFMVTTVIQNKTIQELELPEAYNVNAKSKADSGDLEIYLANIEGDNFLSVNTSKASFRKCKELIHTEVAATKNKGIHIKQAILYIDGNMPMSQVNQVKSELQELNILKVNYIHRLNNS